MPALLLAFLIVLVGFALAFFFAEWAPKRWVCSEQDYRERSASGGQLDVPSFPTVAD